MPHLHGHHHHSGKRLRQFLRPNGTKVHIASSPEDADHIRKGLADGEKDVDYDLFIHGSPEHIDALRHTHAHHEDMHRQLKEKHGDIVDEFERVLREMDALSNELHMISEHAVQLDANFSKYGYSAHLRTKDDASDDSSSGSFDKNQWEAERKQGGTMRFYQRPIVRQYFHKGLLWRAREAQEVGSYELFVDLFYVGIIAITGDHAAEHPTGKSLLHFVIIFIMSWKFWSDLATIIGWIDADDLIRRLSVLFILTCLLGFTTNINDAWEHTYTPLVAFYLASRLFVAASYTWFAWKIPMVRATMIGNAIMIIIPCAFWVASIHVEEGTKQGLIWPAIFFDLFGATILLHLSRPASWMGQTYIRWAKEKAFEFTPAANIEHRIERTAAFVTLVFGSCVLGLLYQSSVGFGINAFFGKAVLGLILAFTFNWIYFEIDAWNLHTHAIRRSVWSASIWITIHAPFIMSFVLGASSLGVLVRAHDTHDADVDTLYETFVARSEGHLPSGLPWFFCGGVGVALACMGVIAMTHIHKVIPNQRLGKRVRLVFRFVVAAVIIVLPTAHMDSLDLVGTTAGLVVAVLVVDVLGSTCQGENLLARCNVTRGELEESVKTGEVLRVEELAKRDGKGEVGAV
ncbi:hypothetical protein BU24DRAFT_433436 [Aaosphaeria arxii CBS 175.79]|uniref:Low temperature requirement A n=1 Tax=Aaosphaeria arxii CBS 175.79 TaxID=1450172 RepID=A0A6A5XT17_9PLEO|nr:uncharacterized protein BU24DRAFT_433436 [Aaosphaeria arxii CBS 175.79]KAF2016428.1 hypothetical protein BU24DRAFT_433436 [Aaosphaeria arxii CBS 175.79]